MSYLEFLRLVMEMRKLQKSYFNPATRTQEVLEKSKAAERAVDNAIKDYFNGQPSLFAEKAE